MKKFIYKALVVTLSIAFITSCSKTATENAATSEKIETVDTKSEEAPKSEEVKVDNQVADIKDVFPITVIDQAGREVEIKAKPEKIVSSYQISSYALIAMGLSDKVVGVENKPETRPFYKAFAPDLINATQVGSLKEVNLEAIAGLNPDLVIIPFQKAEVADELKTLGITAIVVEPESQDDFFEMIELVGKATGTSQRGKELTDFYNEKQKLLLEKTSTITQRKSAYVSSNADPLRALTNQMFQTSLLDLAGIDSVTKDLEGKKWVDISLEQLYTYNPEIMFCAAFPSYVPTDFVKDSKWADLNFVKNNQLFVFPSSIDSWDQPSFCSILGAYWATSTVYPELVSKQELEEISKQYYKLFFNVDITATELGLW